MDQTLNAGLEFDKRAKVHQAGHFAAYKIRDRVFRSDVRPRAVRQVADSQADFATFGVNFPHQNLDALAHGEDFAGMFNALPTELTDMHQAIDAAQIDERAKI